MQVKYKEREINLPDFLIVGAARSGTTFLVYLLQQHPRIFFPAVKEPMFFSLYEQEKVIIDVRTGRKVDYAVENLDNYLQLFKGAKKGQLIGEASTWYLYFYEATLANIAKVYGQAMDRLKVIILLRNPVERAWSHYWLKRRNGEESLSFDQAISASVVAERREKNYTPGFDYLEYGKYFLRVKAYLDSEAKTKVIIYEDLLKDKEKLMKELFLFLGVEPVSLTKYQQLRVNVAGRPKNRLSAFLGRLVYQPHALKSSMKALMPYHWRARWKNRLASSLFIKESIPEEWRLKLVEFYRDDVHQLGALLNRDLTFWLEER